MHRVLALTLAGLASGCVCTKTIDSTWLHVNSKLTQHYEAVPWLGTSTRYELEVEGFGNHYPSCSSDRGGISAAPDGRRLAYWCGDSGWHVLYLEGATTLPLCETIAGRLNWKEVRTFKDAAVDLGLCASLERFVKIADLLEGQTGPGQLEDFFVQTFEREASPPPGWVQALGARPAEFRVAVLERIRTDLAVSEESWGPEGVSAFIEVGKGTAPRKQ
ncbi:MAG: hypothetical protein Q8L48_41415 [Archangium sp.]|nr:hypothetical protein [Archangium sp.]